RTCHAAMDAHRPAFAMFDFYPYGIKYGLVNGGSGFEDLSRVNARVNRLGEGQFKDGILIKSDEFVNYSVMGELGQKFGWRNDLGQAVTTPIMGKGLKAYGKMIGQSVAFSNCMAKTVFENVCKMSPSAAQTKDIVNPVARQFENATEGNYRLQWLFQRMATHPGCTSTEAP
ncbi:MAG: hypothetical protein K2X47_03900, partial [Bdellovibrionales bacterium]|nr:hypothetical protein [Bdellovibrionales bacterium]